MLAMTTGLNFFKRAWAMEMTRLRKATKNVASLSRLEKSGKVRPDFPTFPQLLLRDSYINVKDQNSR